jgi:two-component system, sensor histidine kinase
LLDQVYQTGETFFGHELPLTIWNAAGQALREHYFTFTYQAYREDEQIVGISTFAHEVTEQVRARRAIEQSEQQALALAAELRQTNHQLVRTNVELGNFIYTASPT